MGKMLNTTYRDTVEDVTGIYNTLIDNPLYQFNDKKPTLCTYYNINKDFSSLDPGSKLQMDNIGSDSPIRYNRIYDLMLYGFNRIELQMNNDDFGLEAEKIEGECYILPNTIIPTEGDYFEVSHIKDSTWLFMVKDVQKDTLDNGSNVYKINYKLEYLNNIDIQNKIVYNFRYLDVREGTNIAKIVRCEDYDIAKLMDEKAVMLKGYFEELFYNKRVQTFIYSDLTEFRVYDPFMIEFLIRNGILDNGEDSYIYVTHQIPTVATFSIDYDKTFFRVFEKNEKDRLLGSNRYASMEEIKAYGTTFAGVFENYYKADYNKRPGYAIECFGEELSHKIVENRLETDDSNKDRKTLKWQNILIRYFNNTTITTDELNAIDEMDFTTSKDAFYIIPLLIFCLERAIEKALK